MPGELLTSMRAALIAVLLLFGAGLIGTAALPARWRSFHPGLAAMQALSWGLTLTSAVMWVVGTIVGTAAAGWAAAGLLVVSGCRLRAWWTALRRALVMGGRWVTHHPLGAGILAVPVLWSIPSLILPIVDSDGLRYHLALPKLYLLEGRVFLYPWDVGGAYPQGGEMLSLLSLLVGAGLAVKWLHFMITGLAVAMVVIMVGGRRPGGVFGAWSLAVTPAVLAGASAAFVDGFAAFHIAVAAVGLKRRVPAPMVGLAAAGALWTKWTMAPAVFGILLVLAVQGRPAGRLRRMLAGLAPVLLVLAPICIRNTVETGDPFFPIVTGMVNDAVPGVDPELMDTVAQRHRHIAGPLGIPWGQGAGAVEADEIVGWHHLAGLVLMPLFLRDRRVRLAAALVGPYLAVGLVYHPSIRLAIPLLWGLAVAEGVILDRWRRPAAAGVMLVVTVMLFPSVGREYRPLFGPVIRGEIEGREAVQRLVPGADAARWINRQPDGGRVMALDFPAPALFDRPWVAEGLVNRPPLAMWLDAGEDVAGLLDALHRLDIRWIIVTPGYGGGKSESLVLVGRGSEQHRTLLQLRENLHLVYRKDGVDIWSVPPRS